MKVYVIYALAWYSFVSYQDKVQCHYQHPIDWGEDISKCILMKTTATYVHKTITYIPHAEYMLF